MELIALADLGTPPTGWQLTFTSIPQTFHTLKLIGSTKGQTSSAYDQLYLQFEINGSWEDDDGGQNVTAFHWGNTSGSMAAASPAVSEGYTYSRFIYYTSEGSSYAQDFGGWEITIGDYTNATNIYKSMWFFNADTQSFGAHASQNSYLLVGGATYDTNTSGSNGQITGIRARSYSGTDDKFTQGSTIGLYGLD